MRSAQRSENETSSQESARWLFALDHRSYNARHLRRWHVDAYERRIAHAGTDEKMRTRASWFLLRAAFPWRFSYLLRGDPVRIVLAGSRELRSRALGQLLANVRTALEPNAVDRFADKFLS